MRPTAALGCVATVALTVAACGGGSSSSTGTSGTSGSSGTANTSAYCNQARQVQQAEAAAANPNVLKDLSASLDQLAAVAPSEVAPSVHTLSAFYDRFLAALGSNSPSDQTAVRNAQNAALGNQQSEVRAASQKVLDYTKKTCNIDLSRPPSGSTTTTKP